MKRLILWFVTMLLSMSAHAAPALTLIQTIPLPDVTGRIDHLAMDVRQSRLFVAALGNHSVEVIDLHAGKVVHRISGVDEPQGIAYLSVSNRLIVTDGSAGRIEILDGQTFRSLNRIDGVDDADNVRIDAAVDRIYVGYGSGGVQVLNAKNGDVLETIPLPAHPEAFEIDHEGGKIFINVPDRRQITVSDRRAGGVTEDWKLDGAEKNFPMALDAKGRRLFVGTRQPALLRIYDADHGKLIGQLPVGEDPDDVFFDADSKRLYVICGNGEIKVIRQEDRNRYSVEATVSTRHGARTGLLVPELHRLYVAVPRLDMQDAEIRVFAVPR